MGLSLDRVSRGEGSHAQRIWKLIAFLGRYAHQSAEGLLKLPVADLQELAKQVSKILEEEAEAYRRET